MEQQLRAFIATHSTHRSIVYLHILILTIIELFDLNSKKNNHRQIQLLSRERERVVALAEWIRNRCNFEFHQFSMCTKHMKRYGINLVIQIRTVSFLRAEPSQTKPNQIKPNMFTCIHNDKGKRKKSSGHFNLWTALSIRKKKLQLAQNMVARDGGGRVNAQTPEMFTKHKSDTNDASMHPAIFHAT